MTITHNATVEEDFQTYSNLFTHHTGTPFRPIPVAKLVVLVLIATLFTSLFYFDLMA